MRKYITRLIPLAFLVIQALMVVMEHYSWQLCLGALVFAAVPGILSFWKKDSSMPELLPWFVVSGLLVKLVLPAIPFDLMRLVQGLQKLLPIMEFLTAERMTIPLLGTLIVAQWKLRKEQKVHIVLVRYLLLYILLQRWANVTLYRGEVYSELFLCLVTAYMMREMLTLNRRRKVYGMLPCICLAAAFLYIPCITGFSAAQEIAGFFRMTDETWQRNLLLVASMAALFWMDGTISEDGVYIDEEERQQAVGLFVWCIVYLLMRCWGDLLNYYVLYLWFPAAYSALVFFHSRKVLPAPALWLIAIAVLMALAKSFNLDLYCGPMMLLSFLVAALFWKHQHRLGIGGFPLLLGICSVLVLYSVQLGSRGELTLDAKQLLLPVMLCLSWWVITDHTRRLNQMVSKSHPAEFAVLHNAAIPLALVPTALAVLNVLFVL